METFSFHSFLFKGEIIIFKELLINEQIVANEIRLVGENGEQLGIVPISKGLELASSANLDLVLMSTGATPYVCKIMNYGKFKFDAMKKEKELKKKQKISELKEIQLSMTIDTHDLEVKSKHGLRFLSDGDKIKVVLRMKGREQAYAKTAIEVVKNFYSKLAEFGSYDKEPEIVGRNVIMIISPNKK